MTRGVACACPIDLKFIAPISCEIKLWRPRLWCRKVWGTIWCKKIWSKLRLSRGTAPLKKVVIFATLTRYNSSRKRPIGSNLVPNCFSQWFLSNDVSYAWFREEKFSSSRRWPLVHTLYCQKNSFEDSIIENSKLYYFRPRPVNFAPLGSLIVSVPETQL